MHWSTFLLLLPKGGKQPPTTHTWVFVVDVCLEFLVEQNMFGVSASASTVLALAATVSTGVTDKDYTLWMRDGGSNNGGKSTHSAAELTCLQRSSSTPEGISTRLFSMLVQSIPTQTQSIRVLEP